MAEEKQTPLITAYFYHTRLTTESLEEWRQHRFPGHILYGLPLLQQHGIGTVLHRYRPYAHRLRLMLYATWQVLCCRRPYDVLYATSFRGIEPIVLLRALGLYRKPIVLWHHTAVTRSGRPWRERLSRLFYRGIDRMFFFSSRHIEESLATGKVPVHKLKLVHWGPDVAFYDHLRSELPANGSPCGFISTGKENRDVQTLLHAFAHTEQELELYIAPTCGEIDYRRLIGAMQPLPTSVQVHYTEGVIPYELARRVAGKCCIVICCLEHPYTVGLTTLVEALALGMPVICSRNPYFEIDIEAEGAGIAVPYGDVQGWVAAIDYIARHPEEAARMGHNARRLAEERFNLEIFSREVAENLHEVTRL